MPYQLYPTAFPGIQVAGFCATHLLQHSLHQMYLQHFLLGYIAVESVKLALCWILPSGSMKGTDPDKLRYEAIDLFVGLLANGGNCVGSVVFSNGVVSQHSLSEVKNKNDKKIITDDLKDQPVGGWTDIGGGLQAALNLLENGGNKEIPSIIILLTDGNTEMATKELTEKSVSDKEDAMELARQKGVKIYTISLDRDHSANSDEMKQIANATGGEFRAVSKASDLQDVFDLYYQLIYSTKSTKLVDESVPDTGVISRDFSVVDLGVEEVNIAIFGDIGDCVLTRPDKSRIPQSEMQDMIYRGETFSLIKLSEPIYGIWNLSIEAAPGAAVKIFKICNANLQVVAKVSEEKELYILGEPIRIIAQIKEDGFIVTDTLRYQGYQATLKAARYDGEEVYTQTVDSASMEGYVFSFTPNDYGTYYVHVFVENEELYAETEKIPFNVGNTPPVTLTDVINKHINIWPFLIKTDASIDLSSAARDTEDSQLSYRVKSSTWLDGDYTLDGTTLTIDDFSVSKGSFTIEAYDSLGAYCTFEVQVTSTNIGLIAVIFIFGGGLIALAAIAVLTWRLSQKLFMGRLEIENLAPPYISAVQQKNRGKLRIRSLQVGSTGLDKDAHFQATGKNFVYFVSKTPVYNDYTGAKSKKIKIESSTDYRISSDDNYQTGIRVRFESMLNNNF